MSKKGKLMNESDGTHEARFHAKIGSIEIEASGTSKLVESIFSELKAVLIAKLESASPLETHQPVVDQAPDPGKNGGGKDQLSAHDFWLSTTQPKAAHQQVTVLGY
jgi:hypothetical protein